MTDLERQLAELDSKLDLLLRATVVGRRCLCGTTPVTVVGFHTEDYGGVRVVVEYAGGRRDDASPTLLDFGGGD